MVATKRFVSLSFGTRDMVFAVPFGFGVIGTGIVGLSRPDTAGMGPVMAGVGLTLVLVAGLMAILSREQFGVRAAFDARLFRLIANDPAPWFATDDEGRVRLRNAAAEAEFGSDARSIRAALSRHLLEPGPLLLKLQKTAVLDGSARQVLATRSLGLRITVQHACRGRFLWRVDEFPTPDQTTGFDDARRTGAEGDGNVFDDVPVPLMLFGRDGVLRRSNSLARELLLQSPDDVAVFHDLFDGLGRPVADWLADVVDGRLPGGTEVLRARRCEGDAFMQVTLHRHVEGSKTGAVAVIHDATRLKALETQVAQSQKMQAIGQLAGGIAHDFNNLLTAISGHCDLLFLRHAPEDSDFADLQQIRQNANRAAALVGQLLAFSRKQTLQPELIDLEELLSDLTHLMNRLIGEKVGLKLVQVGRTAKRDLRPIRADRRKLEQVVVNLVINARDAMPGGGTVVIETEPVTLLVDLRRDRAVVPAGDYTVIRVIDQGVGISSEHRQKIFEPFFTTKRVGEGTGLGLSMAYGIVKQSGGFIFVDSAPGEGTAFLLYFPAHEPELTPKPEPLPRPRSIRQREGVVLLVEDEAPVRAFAGRALRLRGYTVLEAENGEEALKVLEDPALEIDVFVTDVMMPGMDGPTWVREALKARPNVRVVFVSGYAEDMLNNDQPAIQNSVFLPKPFSLNDLTRTVQGQLA